MAESAVRDPKPAIAMTSGKAVFLSYASQDAGAAKRLCEALRAAGVEVWFDQKDPEGVKARIETCEVDVGHVGG